MKIKRLNTISTVNGSKIVDYELPTCPHAPYQVDDSQFSPIKELVKQIKNADNLTDAQKSAVYDFVDGKDNGMRIPLSRRQTGDFVELAVEIFKQQNELDQNIKDAEIKATAQTTAKINFEKMHKDLETINSSSNSTKE